MTIRTYFSNRDHPLVFWHDAACGFKKPVLTVENYSKWYDLFLVMPDGKVRPVSFGDLEECCEGGVSPYRDHVPNPDVVAELARQQGWLIDDTGMEMIIGRWERETEGKRYQDTFDDGD